MARFTPDFLDELRARLRPSDVIGRYVKLKKEGREYRGLSPFTTEKTPSFFVNDEKGRYFDFSSSKSGDIIEFMMSNQQMSFPEAVSHLAELAGIDIPEDTPEEAAKAARAKGLSEACLEAAKFFRAMLTRNDGQDGAAYLDRRGVNNDARKVFGIGYAPNSRSALRDYLLNKDYSAEVLVEAGLLIKPDDGGALYDRFRGRVMFPIMGRKGQVIAFGGRALSKDVRAKYLNSPETPLFHKSHTLYNLERARRVASNTAKPVIVAEGYMDVIALDRAGWPAVAPLGTALTEHQLKLLWRSQDQPILCFDGDRAGKAAAFRAVDRALPIIAPGKSLSFIFLPDGMDPDDLLQEKGNRALDPLVASAKPLAEVVWERHLATHPRNTPEEHAQFKQHLRELIGVITEPDVRQAYGQFLGQKLAEIEGAQSIPALMPIENTAPWQDAGPMEPPWQEPIRQNTLSHNTGAYQKKPYRKGQKYGEPPQISVSPALKARVQQSRSGGLPPSDSLREAGIVLCLIHHPALFLAHEDAIFGLEVHDSELSRLLSVVLEALTAQSDLDSEGLRSHILNNSLYRQTYHKWSKHPMVRVARFAQADAEYRDAEMGWLNALSIDRYQGDLQSEVAEAAAEAHLDPRRERTWFDAVSHRAKLLAKYRPSENESEDDKDDTKP